MINDVANIILKKKKIQSQYRLENEIYQQIIKKQRIALRNRKI